jgi:hypothetical protein
LQHLALPPHFFILVPLISQVLLAVRSVDNAAVRSSTLEEWEERTGKDRSWEVEEKGSQTRYLILVFPAVVGKSHKAFQTRIRNS